MTSRPRNRYSLSNKDYARLEKCRKSSSYHEAPPKEIDTEDFSPPESRYDDFQYTTDNEYKLSDERTSNESLTFCNVDLEGNENAESDYRDVPAEPKQREKFIRNVTYSSYPSSRRSPSYSSENYEEPPTFRPNLQSRSQEYCKKKVAEPKTTNEALLAVQRLRQLQELQFRRDITEKYYSQEIRRLIQDHVARQQAVKPTLGRPPPPPPPLPSSPPPSPYFNQQYPAGSRASSIDSLEPCGTMTTITRLNCGCLEETTRPIFTTPGGRSVQKRNCAQDQQMRLRMSQPVGAAAARLVHHQQVPAVQPKLRSKSFAEQPRSAGAILSNRRTPEPSAAAPAAAATAAATAAPRTASPVRKNSESSGLSA